MTDFMYGLNSFVIAGALLVFIALAIEGGHRIGRVKQESASKSTKEHVNAIQASLVGVLALLLGFSFSLAFQRFERLSEAVVTEANAISATYLRAQLLPPAVGREAAELLQRYVDLRVHSGAISLDKEAERQALLGRTNEVLDALWGCALRATEAGNSPATSGLFTQSLNETIAAYERRDADLSRHVPDVISFLLYGTFLLTGGVIGYSAGLAGHRPSLATYILVAVIVVLAFINMDLDRPRRGLILVDQTSLTHLKAAIDAAQAVGTQPTAPADLRRPAVTGRR